jgi:phytoene desaturase
MNVIDRQRQSAAVIGSGFGGLAVAIRLQAAGVKTTIFEKRDKPGGRAYVYTDRGFVFDGGPTVLTDPAAIAELFAVAGRRMEDYVEMLPVSPFYRLCWEDGYVFDYDGDQVSLDRQIAAKSPDDVEGYRRFFEYSKELLEEGYVKLGTTPFLDFKSMLKATPALVRLKAYRSVYARVASFIKDEQLRQAFSFHSLLIGGNPFEASAVYALIHALERKWGVWFARGGTGALVRALVKLFEDIGGTIHVSTPILELVETGNLITGVRTERFDLQNFDAVVSNADVVHTYANLLKSSSRGKSEGRRLAKSRHSMSLFVVYFGLRAEHPQLAHHMVLFGPRYRELISEIFKGPGLADDFSLYLHAPSVTDRSLAPPGCSSYYVLAPVPHLGTVDIDWDVEGPRYASRILDYLEERQIPNLRRDLVTMSTLTPFGFRDELNAHLGSAFSVEPILTQSAWFRPLNRDDVIKNLYLVGAGTHPGAGVPGVIGSAKATAGVMLADFEIKANAA